MFIHEAIAEARKSPSVIARPCFFGSYLIVPMSPGDYIYGCSVQTITPVPGWEPTVEDLQADDWFVTKAEGFEWLSATPTPIQRSWKRFFQRKIH